MSLSSIALVSLIAVGMNGTVVKTTDGGATWAAADVGAGTTSLYEVLFVGGSGWVTGNSGQQSTGLIRKTTDGGVTWVAQTSPTGNTMYQFAFVDAQNGWGVGD